MFLWTIVLVVSFVSTTMASSESVINEVLDPAPPLPPALPVNRENVNDFLSYKAAALSQEFTMTLGYNVFLSPMELTANKVITDLKLKEIEKGFLDPSKFMLTSSNADTLAKIDSSKLYNLIKKMPKGGILHAHDTALGSSKILVKLIKKDNCYVCVHADNSLEFKFSREKPEKNDRCSTWDLMTNYRTTTKISDEDLMKKFRLPDKSVFKNVNDVWIAFEPIFKMLGGIIRYKDNYEDYLKSTLKELFDDGVQYVELRSSLKELHDLDGKKFTRLETAKLIEKVVNDFIKENPSFIGARVIFSKHRKTNKQKVKSYLEDAKSVKSQAPKLVCGFDLVGQEDLGKPLQDFLPELLSAPGDMKFFFHAGETNWYGTTTDENLIDAVMMRPIRIGHGYALNKHPLVLDLIRELDIAIEINPISNLVLDLVADYRNHPGAYFIANNVPMVVSSDDPSFWGAAPLSHDFFITFLGIASAHTDLRLLKKLAYNSIKYSCMSREQKKAACKTWKKAWNEWIKEVAAMDT